MDFFVIFMLCFALLASNSQFIRTLYPINTFLKQFHQLVLNICQFLGLIESYFLKYSSFSDFDPLRPLFANSDAIFAPLAPNSQFIRTLYPIKPFLKQLYQLVLNICQFLGIIESYFLKYSKFSDF